MAWHYCSKLQYTSRINIAILWCFARPGQLGTAAATLGLTRLAVYWWITFVPDCTASICLYKRTTQVLETCGTYVHVYTFASFALACKRVPRKARSLCCMLIYLLNYIKLNYLYFWLMSLLFIQLSRIAGHQHVGMRFAPLIWYARGYFICT